MMSLQRNLENQNKTENQNKMDKNNENYQEYENCPICGVKMRKGNIFCSIKCYNEFNNK